MARCTSAFVATDALTRRLECGDLGAEDDFDEVEDSDEMVLGRGDMEMATSETPDGDGDGVGRGVHGVGGLGALEGVGADDIFDFPPSLRRFSVELWSICLAFQP